MLDEGWDHRAYDGLYPYVRSYEGHPTSITTIDRLEILLRS